MNIPTKIALVLFLTSTLCMAKGGGGKNKNNNPPPPPDTTSCVTAINPGTDPGTATIVIQDAPTFLVGPNTTIMIDGQPGTLNSIQTGMQVLSQTSPDSSAPEIDLKTVPKADGQKKKKGSSSGE